MSVKNSAVLEYLYNEKLSFSQKKYEYVKRETNEFLLTPLKVMALLIAISGLFAMIFEVRYFSGYSIQIYFTRLIATLISFVVLVLMYTNIGLRKSVLLVHILLLVIIISSGYMIYLMPDMLIINSQIVGLMIFTSALFLSWELKNQIIVAIYYNIVFASAILLNDKSIYFLPHMYETVLFVIFLSVISVIGSAVNFRLRMQIAEKSYSVEESERKYHSIFDNAFEGLFQVTLQGKFITVNKALTEILGYYSVDEVLQLDVKNDIYKYPEERELILKKIKEEKAIENYRLTLKKKDGSDVIVKLNNRLVVNEDTDEIYLEGNIQDITTEVLAEKKRADVEKELREEKQKSDKLAEKALKSNTTKSQFLANMSHEIRTPMNGIIGYLTLVEQDACESREEMKQFVSNAKHSAESLLDIINNILDLSKIESGKIELESKSFDLEKSVDEAVNLLSLKAKEKNIKIIRDFENCEVTDFIGDATRMRQIYLNLLSNAIKFTDKGEITIYAEAQRIDDGNVLIYSHVKDTGMGIAADKIGHLFKPFSQVGDSQTKQVGTGLGLVICKEFINLMGGEINVESEEGKGTKFYFNIKLKAATSKKDTKKTKSFNRIYNLDPEPEKMEEIQLTDLKNERSKHKILLAEDNVINQKVISRILSQAGYTSDIVGNGLQAFEAVKEKSYSLILMDVQMPEMDGLTAAANIRKLKDERKKDIPIIAITAHALMGDKERCLSTGMNEYITKPIIAEKLLALMDQFLKTKQNKRVVKMNTESKFQSKDTFDFAHLDKISMGDVPFQKEILLTYLEDLEKRYKNLENLFIRQDYTKLNNEAHTVKGASLSIGAVKVGEEALAIEISCKHNDLENLEIRIKNLKTIVEETKDILNDYIKNNVTVDM